MNACHICPSLNNPTASFEKEEKVVKPPKKPVTKKSLHSMLKFPRSVSPKIIPIRKQPIILTAIVPKGNADKNLFWTYCEKKYRDKPPKQLPIPTDKIILIAYFL